MVPEELYQKIREEHISLASHMIMTVYDDMKESTYDALQKKLTQIDFLKDPAFKEVDGVLRGSFQIGEEEYTGDFIYEPFEDDGYKRFLFEVSSYAHLPENAMPHLMKATGNLTFLMDFHEDARADFLLQLKILCALSNHIAVIYDKSAYHILPMEQVHYLLSMKTLPSYDILYTVHDVYDPDGTHWLHTHGLLRCALIELEILKIKNHVNAYYELLNTTVKRYLEDGLPSEDEPINVGYASMITLDVKWTPWEKALEQETKRHLFQKKAQFCGSYKDREEEHSTPSGVLYAYYEHKFQPIRVYDTFLGDNPILYISNAETARMADYAKEALPYLRQIFEEHKAENENYAFLIKAGMDVDDQGDGDICGEREHLWFDIQDIKENSFYGELTNEPYGVSYMKCGECYEVELSRISDYLIMRSEGVNLHPSNMYLYMMEHPLN